MLNKVVSHIASATPEYFSSPFDHWVMDNFFPEEMAIALSDEFPDYSSSKYHHYSNAIEEKKTLNNWNQLPTKLYQVSSFLNSPLFVTYLSKLTHTTIQSDPGLHGGGLHIHKCGGKLNPHLDYSLHPKLGLQRKLNLIIYLSQDIKPEYGGHLGLWEGNQEGPTTLIKEVFPQFNRAVLFDTTQCSWHGISKALQLPEGSYRKSLAIYYLCEPQKDAATNTRAKFAPVGAQKNDKAVLQLIKERQNEATVAKSYKT
jgi:hypothetical protein